MNHPMLLKEQCRDQDSRLTKLVTEANQKGLISRTIISAQKPLVSLSLLKTILRMGHMAPCQ
jgi:hypothetical protein